MEKLLKAKHWQIFILICTGMIIGGFSIPKDPTTTVLLRITGILIYMIYPLAVGHFLQDHLPPKVKLNHSLFLINVFFWIAAYSIILVISDGKGMTFTGLSTMPGFYGFYAFFHSFLFPARTIKSIKLREKATFDEYLADSLLFAFLPVGIWVLQPRVNKIVEENDGVVSDN